MHKKLMSNLLLIMFLVGAASGFFVSSIGLWGLYQSARNLDQIYQRGSELVGRALDVETQALHSQALFLDALRRQQLSQADKDALISADDQLQRLIASLQGDAMQRANWEEITRLSTRLAESHQQALNLLETRPEDVYRFHTGSTLPLFNDLMVALHQSVPHLAQEARNAYLQAADANRGTRNALLTMTLLASVFFCLTAWLTYRESAERRRKEAQLDEGHTLFRTLFESSNDGVIMLNRGSITDANRAALRMFGVPSLQTLMSLAPGRLQPECQPDGQPSATTFAEHINASLQRGHQRFEWQFRTLDGKEFPAEVAMDVAHLDKHSVVQITICDITRRKKAETSMRLANQAFENSLEGMAITDASANILSVNHAFTAITGYRVEEVVGRNPRLLSSGRQTRDFYEAMWQSITTTGKWQGEIWNMRKNGEIYPQWLNISSVKDEHGVVTNYVGVFNDISERKSAEERILHQVYYDQLTDLPNRALFTDRLQQVLGAARRNPGRHFAVMFLDLDRFKLINDSMGHDAGDKLLQQVSHRLRGSVRESDTVARMSGDEFTIVLSEIANPQHAAGVAQKILEVFRPPFHLNGEEVFVSASIGISVYPEDGTTIEALLKNADMAMYRAKGAGGAWYQLYDEGLGSQATQRLATETALHKALERNEMVLHYQPQFDCGSGRLLGFEALLRWHHPERGLLGPEAFLPIAEETGLIVPIGEWVLRTACAQAQAWRRDFPGHRLMAVNLSARQFNSADLARQIADALRQSGLPHFCLELEITESVVMQNLDSSIAIMHHLAELGIQFSIDSFGTGHSSFAFLRKLPVHALKINRAFVRHIDTDQDDAAIVGAIIAMANKLGLRVVAEGVEENAQLDYFKKHKNIACQGYLLGRPIAADAATKLIAEGKPQLAIA
ncbi:hypothetical protein GCM10027343_03760 [Noviherbaspirillum agri]